MLSARWIHSCPVYLVLYIHSYFQCSCDLCYHFVYFESWFLVIFFFFWQILFICSCVLFDYQYFDYLYLFNNSTYDLFFFFFFLFLIFSYPFIYLINLLKITPLIMCNLFYILLVKFNKFYKPLKGSSNFLVKIAEHHLSYFDKKIPNPPFLGKNWWCIQKQQILSYIFMCFF